MVVQRFEDLPARATGWKSKLIKWLGGISEYNVAYITDVGQFVVRDRGNADGKGWRYISWNQSVRFVEHLDMFLQMR